MSKTILWLKPQPMTADQWLSNNPLCVHYACEQIADVKKTGRNSLIWKVRQSDGNFHSTNELFNKLQNIPVSGKPLIEFVVYKDLSYWQFLPSYIWPVFFRAVESIKVLTSIIEEISADTIKVFPAYDCNFSIWKKTVQSIASVYKIRVVFIKPRFFKSIRSFYSLFKYRLRQLSINGLLKVHSAISDLFLKLIKKRESFKLKNGNFKKILFASLERHWIRIPGQSAYFYDEQIYPLLPQLRSRGWNYFVGIDCPYSLSSILNVLFRRNRGSEPEVIWSSFYSFDRMRKTKETRKNARRVFCEQWDVLEKDSHLSKDFQYNGIKLMQILKGELKHAFFKILPECAQMTAIADKILLEEAPKAIILTYETGPYQRALINVARFRGIPTLGLMHGMIFDNHYDYMHSNIVASPAQKSVGFVVPQVTCVWGPLWERNLTEFGFYPKEAVKVTGNWRYDRIIKRPQFIDIKILKQRLGLSLQKKIILIASSGCNTPDYVRKCLEVILLQENLVPLIKLHPVDKRKPIIEILQSLRLPIKSLIDCQLIEAVLVSDLVITQISTVLSEAALLGKDIILADFQDLKGWEQYLEKDFFLLVKNRDELDNALKRLLYDDKIKEKLSLARPKFISDCFFKIDGNSAERVVDTLEKKLSCDGKNFE